MAKNTHEVEEEKIQVGSQAHRLLTKQTVSMENMQPTVMTLTSEPDNNNINMMMITQSRGLKRHNSTQNANSSSSAAS